MKLHINGYKRILSLELTDHFAARDANGKFFRLDIHRDKSEDVYVLRYNLHIIGWTNSTNDAFSFFRNVGMYTAEELWELARGRAI